MLIKMLIKKFICGDYNINLLKYEDDTYTKNFVDTMCCMGLTPVTNMPTRITEFSSTLIDNIFTNCANVKLSSGGRRELGPETN